MNVLQPFPSPLVSGRSWPLASNDFSPFVDRSTPESGRLSPTPTKSSSSSGWGPWFGTCLSRSSPHFNQSETPVSPGLIIKFSSFQVYFRSFQVSRTLAQFWERESVQRRSGLFPPRPSPLHHEFLLQPHCHQIVEGTPN
jgi:hypothetical protein